MLGASAVVLRSSGAFAQLQEPVSFWPLDSNAQDAKPTQNDGTFVGDPELGLLPLEDAGESIGLDGVDDAVEIPHHTAYEEAAWAWHLKIQPDTTPATGNRVILGKGTFLSDGEISIEQRTSGLNAYTTQGGTAFWQGPGGSADGVVPLTPGVACDVIFQGGPGGTELWHRPAGGSWALVGFSAATSGLAANTAPIFLGRSPYGDAWFDGLVDNLAFFPRYLSAQDRALIPPPVSPAHQATAALMVPRLDLWLPNDDFAIPSGGTKRYVKADGVGVGGTTEGAAGELHATLAASAAGDTVICLQGYYSAPNGVTIKAGSSATSPTTLMAKPGEWAVLCHTTAFLNTGLLDTAPGEGASKTWTLHDAATNTWRMPYGGSATWPALEGCWFQGGMAHMLFPYPSLTALMSARDTSGIPQTKDSWFFSGITVSGGFAYIRLDRPNWRDMVNGATAAPHPTYGAWPDDGRYTIGVEAGGTPTWFSRSNPSDFKTGRPTIGQGLDPNNLRIYLGAHNNTRLLNNASGNFTRFGSGINSMGYRWYTTSRSNHEAHRGVHYVPGYVIFPADGTVSNVTFHRARLFSYGEHRLQGSMAVMKYDEFLNPPGQMLQNTHRNGLVASQGGQTISNICFDNCSIYYFHECCVGGGVLNKCRFVNCCFHMIYDEWGQWENEDISQIEVGWSYFRDSAIFFGGSIASSATQNPFCSEWQHHNIQDNRLPRSTFDSRIPRGGAQSNGRDLNCFAARKTYNNTLIAAPDMVATRTHALGWDCNEEMIWNSPGGVATYDEAFNNIVILHDTKRYTGNEGVTNTQHDSCEKGALITNGSGSYNKHYRDYNLYYRNVPVDPATGSLSNKKFFDISGTYLNGHDFDYVRTNTGLEPGNTVFFNSPDYNLTVNNIGQPGGWESHASDENPQIPSVSNFPTSRMDYRPQNVGACGAPSTPPTGANWWSSPGWTSYGATPVPFNMAPSPWKGALDPNGTTVPVGVQNP